MSPDAPGPVVVTGAGGYLGSRLLGHLPGPVRALVRTPVPYLPADDQVVVDLTADVDELARVCAGARAIVHLAGHNEVVAAADPDRALAETQLGTRHVAEAARAAGVPRVVYVSTIHVYGAAIAEDAVVSEDLAPAPTSTYAIARLASEHLLAQSGLDVVVLRLTNAVGAPRSPAVNRWTLVAADLCRQAVRDGALTLRSSGLQWRDFIDLGDVCRTVAASTDTDVAPGTYNLATGRPATIRDVAELVQAAFERHTDRRPPLHAPAHDGPVPRPYRVAVDRLAAQRLSAGTPIADAVDELARFCLDHEDQL